MHYMEHNYSKPNQNPIFSNTTHRWFNNQQEAEQFASTQTQVVDIRPLNKTINSAWRVATKNGGA